MDESSPDEHGKIGKKNRRDTLIVIGIVIVMMAGGFLAARWINPGYSQNPYQREADVLDDHVRISAYGKKQSQVEAAVDEAFKRIYDIDAVSNRFRNDSEVSYVNANAADHPVATSEDLWAMLSISMQAYRESNGLFDITIAPLVDLWDVTGRGARGDPPPSDQEIKQALVKIGGDKLVLDEANHTVYFPQPGMGIDLGGMAKGYALDQATAALKAGGVDTGVIDMISTSMVLGSKPGGNGTWEIAISNPRSGDYLGTFAIKGDSYVSTSGDNQRYFDYNGVRYCHILDPRTGYPARGIISDTIVGSENATWSDIMSTTAFIMGYPDGMSWVEGAKHANAVIVDAAGQVHASQGMEQWIENLQTSITP
jgi:thiamine biosynthesis lipoprotein